MMRELAEHMVKKAYACGDIVLAGAVDIYLTLMDVSFVRRVTVAFCLPSMTSYQTDLPKVITYHAVRQRHGRVSRLPTLCGCSP